MIPRIINLGSDIANYDSSYWYPRMDDFTSKLIKGEYQQTYQKYHPGVILLWTSGTSKYMFEQVYEQAFGFNPRFIPHQFTKLHFAAKFPLVLLISVLGTIQFFIIRKLLNTKFALIYVLVLSFEPFFLGVSKFLHLSALTSMFMFTSFLSLLYYYKKKDSSYWIFIASSILLALGALTKIDAIITGPVNLALILFYERKDGIKKIIKDLFIYGITFAFIFYILFPSMWVTPYWTIMKIVQEGIKDTAFSSGGAPTYSGIRELYYPEMIFFRSLPSTSILFYSSFILILIGIFNKKDKFKLSKNSLILWTVLFLVFNLFILTVPDKIKDRYLINLYPPIALLTSISFYYILKLKNKILKYSIIGVIVFWYLLTIYRYHPVYSFYYTDLIGGPGGRLTLGLPIKNRGEYYARAALYINRHDDNPEVRNVVISRREQTRTFPQFFVGETFTNPKFMKDGYYADYILAHIEFDYLVPRDKCEKVKGFGPKEPFGFDILTLYKCEGITNEYKDFKN